MSFKLIKRNCYRILKQLPFFRHSITQMRKVEEIEIGGWKQFSKWSSWLNTKKKLATKPLKNDIFGSSKYDDIFASSKYYVPPEEDPTEKRMKIIVYLTPVIIGLFLFNRFTSRNKRFKNSSSAPASEGRNKNLTPVKCHFKEPCSSEDIPSDVEYLLIGGGTASVFAYQTIKGIHPRAKILVVSDEPFHPYMRPPLSKYLIYNHDRQAALDLKFSQLNGKERSIYFEPDEFYLPCQELSNSINGGVSVARGWKVNHLDIQNKQAILDDGKIVKYQKCLLAPGGKPKTLPLIDNLDSPIKDKVSVYRGITDFMYLEHLFDESPPKSVAVIGGGFLGSELAVSLARRAGSQGTKVTQIIRGAGPLEKVLPTYLSQKITQHLMSEGVYVETSSDVTDIVPEGDKLKILLNDSNHLTVDHVIVAVGIEPNVDLADSSGLEVDPEKGGYLVNAQMQATADVYIAGDCASFYDVNLKKRRREETHNHAVVTGKIAGENMSGKLSFYNYQSVKWWDINDETAFEAIGVIDSQLPTVAVFAKDDENKEEIDENSESGVGHLRKGVIFYIHEDSIIGILLWNLSNKLAIARQLLSGNRRHSDFNDVAKLFDIHNS